MLTKLHRLTKKKDFDAAFKDGKGYRGRFLAVRIITNSLAAHRIGFIVSTKVSKKAVVRNMVKRRLRAIISGYLAMLAKLKPSDIVIITFPGVEKASFEELRIVIDEIFKKIK